MTPPLTNNIQIEGSWFPPKHVITSFQSELKLPRVIQAYPFDPHRAVSIDDSTKERCPALEAPAHLISVLTVKSDAGVGEVKAPTSEPHPDFHPLPPVPATVRSCRGEGAGNHRT